MPEGGPEGRMRHSQESEKGAPEQEPSAIQSAEGRWRRVQQDQVGAALAPSPALTAGPTVGMGLQS